MNWNSFMDELCDENISSEKKSALIAGVAESDITAEMLAACAEYLLSRAEPLTFGPDALDVCGTGGSTAKTFNVSTAVAFVLAAGGAKVIKHGKGEIVDVRRNPETENQHQKRGAEQAEPEPDWIAQKLQAFADRISQQAL